MSDSIEVLDRTESGGTIETRQFVTVWIENQLFGIPVLAVHDVLTVQRITPIPLAPLEVAGALNLRGRIVTAINVRRALGLRVMERGKSPMYVVAEYDGHHYSLMFDRVGEVMDLPMSAYEDTPSTFESSWREVSDGICRLDGELLIVLDVSRLLKIEYSKAA